MLEKDDEEHRVPEPLRGLFRQIVNAFIDGDFLLRENPVAGVAEVEPEVARDIAKSILAYGDHLAPLDPATWERSCYRWMDDHWLMLVDLSTVSESVSDLTLHARLSEAPDLLVEVQSVHVP